MSNARYPILQKLKLDIYCSGYAENALKMKHTSNNPKAYVYYIITYDL